MFLKLLALFISVPLIELFVLLKIGELLGAWLTVAIIIFTGFLGVLLARLQGFLVMQEFSKAVNNGKMPGNAIVDGLLILIGAAVLLTPGFLTDVFGFVLLIPVSRIIIREIMKKSLRHYFESGRIAIIR